MRRIVIGILAAFGLTQMLLPASAQDYPNKPIRLIVPYAAGGPTDLTGRVIAEFLSTRLGQLVVVENKPGAGTAIGIDLVAKSNPDGYTLLWASTDGLSVLPAVKPTTPYNTATDFSFVSTAVKYSGPLVTVYSKLPINSMAELIAYGKANPGKLRYSSTGVGSGIHLSTALIGHRAGIEMVHVPYQGAAPAILAAASGVVDMMLVGYGTLKPYAEDGRLRPLAVAATKRNPHFPEVPTLEEIGLPSVSVDLYVGLLGPAGMPKAALDRLRQVTAELVKDPKTIERLQGMGAETAALAGDDFKRYMVDDLERWRGVVKSANITLPE